MVPPGIRQLRLSALSTLLLRILLLAHILKRRIGNDHKITPFRKDHNTIWRREDAAITVKVWLAAPGPREKTAGYQGKGGAVQAAVSVQQTFNRRFEVLNTETAEAARLRLQKRGLCSTSLYVPLPD